MALALCCWSVIGRESGPGGFGRSLPLNLLLAGRLPLWVSEVGLDLDLKEAKSTDVFHIIRILGLHDSDKNTVATASMDNSCSYFMLDESVVSVDSGSNLNKSVTWSLGRQWSGSCL